MPQIIQKLSSAFKSAAVQALLLSTSCYLNATTVNVPQSGPYVADTHTVLLEHFDASTSGTPTGPSVGYRSGIYGQAISLTIGSWVSWNMGGLAQGTVEFWGLMDTLDYSGLQPNFIQASYWPFLADTFTTGLFNGVPTTSYHTGFGYRPGGDWVEGSSDQPITAGTWNHFATTWGSDGFHFFINGILVFESSDPYAQNGSTGIWAIGGPNYHPYASGAGFTGAIDELRISNIQRYFSNVPEGSLQGVFPIMVVGLLLARGFISRKNKRQTTD